MEPVAIPRVLVVDDDSAFCELMLAELATRGYEATACKTVREATVLLSEQSLAFEVVITDLNLAPGSGFDVVAHVAKEGWPLPVVVLTGFGSIDVAVKAIRAGAYDFVTKPFDPDALALTLERAVAHARLMREVTRLRRVALPSGGSGLLGESQPMRALRNLIARVAQGDTTVLVTGESGTGKELVARAIHQGSRRASGPLVSLNCGAVPESLLESELFGHLKGAFTDARNDAVGVVREAQGGTLFLDEVGELPMSLQPKLLRVLQERTVRPVGATREVPVDVRVVAATNVDLIAAIEQGRFREDLYYRLDVVNLEVPPLRARGNDVLLLAQEFLGRHADANTPRVLSAEVAAMLVRYSWPGNVRELMNAVERAVTLSTGAQLAVTDFPERMQNRVAAVPPPPDATDASTLLPLEEVERRYVLSVLDQVKGNKRRAAQILGLDRSTLYRRLKDFGVKDDGAKDPA